MVSGAGFGGVIEERGRLDWAPEKALLVGREDIREGNEFSVVVGEGESVFFGVP